MGTKYTTQSISGYNSNPPPDDGTTGDDNKLTWAKHKTKLADPIKTLTEAVDTALVNMVDVAPLAKSGAYTTVADDDGRIIECTSSPTITLGAAATMGAGYRVIVKNTSTGTVTVATGETIDGSASNRTLLQNNAEVYVVNSAGTAYWVASANGLFTDPVLTGDISGNAFLDEDDMSSDSATKVASQQSIKAYAKRWEQLAQFTTTGGTTLGENTSVPAGTERISVVFESINFSSAASDCRIEIGDSTSYSSSSQCSVFSITAITNALNTEEETGGPAIVIGADVTATNNYYGHVDMQKMNDNEWGYHGIITNNAGSVLCCGGLVTLSGVVTRIKVTSAGGNFDIGAAHVSVFA